MITRQEAINKIWDWFFVQGHDQCLDKDNVCLYRLDGTSNCQTRCFIGVLIPDDKYNPQWDSKEPGNGEKFGPEILHSLGLEEEIDFYSRLQGVHDSAINKNIMKKLFIDFIHENDLQVPA